MTSIAAAGAGALAMVLLPQLGVPAATIAILSTISEHLGGAEGIAEILGLLAEQLKHQKKVDDRDFGKLSFDLFVPFAITILNLLHLLSKRTHTYQPPALFLSPSL